MTSDRDAFRKAIELRDKGDIPGAISAFRDALARHGSHAGAWAALGQLLKDTGELNEAIGCFENAARLKPEKDVFSGALFFALLRAHRFREARTEATRFMSLVQQRGVPCADDIKGDLEAIINDERAYEQWWIKNND
jgi:tetratricopeptide (TPR) repeat protein